MSSLLLLTNKANRFSPLNLSGLRLWLDGADTSTITTGGTFTLADKSGNSNDATEVTNQPATGGDINGRNAIVFDGVNDLLTVSASASIANFFHSGGTVFFVGNPTSDGGASFGRIFDKTLSGARLLIENETAATVRLRLIMGFSTTDGDWRTTANPINLGSANLMTATYDGDSTSNNPTFNVNDSSEGVTENTAPVGTIEDDTSADLTIGNSAAGNRGYHGLFGELVIYDRVLSAAEISQVEAYLSDKWNVAPALLWASGGDLLQENDGKILL